MKLICQLLNKYGIFNSTYDNTDFLINNIEDKFISTFAISRFLLEDYLRNGYYSKKLLMWALMKMEKLFGKKP